MNIQEQKDFNRNADEELLSESIHRAQFYKDQLSLANEVIQVLNDQLSKSNIPSLFPEANFNSILKEEL